ncbi:Ribonuclease T1 [Arthrobacter sp. 9AX]|uniref:ribonuclease domain-containing protein n=1 Tax=Arthrobacter sp. 9AX TaxID=2653131 RepID=UPI0012F473C4|nr:ribonuclease domain-containing protein [Arthrobacter sp. 9AX]VXC41374.1 Ribonuclease T1 [Arthrobacter sp. 9AX]
MRNRNVLPLLLTAVVVLVLVAFGGTGVLNQLMEGATTPEGTSSAAPAPPARTPSPPAPSASTAPARGNPSDLPEVRESGLPAEARSTLALIRSGGPFRYSQDDQVFGNFERVLPRKDRGYYREYTVPTPGESDRGARRIVAGDGGEKYYTDDHYGTFRFIAEGS